MGNVKVPSDVKLFVGIMYRPDLDPSIVIEPLKSLYGDIEASYGPIDFDWSDYYKDEMGAGLKKFYILFKDMIPRTRLPEIKNHTNQVELHHSANGKRAVNIDPGYLAVDKLVLASTKDFYHRIYLGDGIFGEVTLHYRKAGGFRFFSWTYPDYQEPGFHEFLEAERKKLLF